MAIWTDGDAEGLRENGTCPKRAEKRAIGAVVFQQLIAEATDDVEMTVVAPRHAGRAVQSAAAVGDEGAGEGAVRRAVSQHGVVQLTADVEKAVGTELEPDGVIQPARAARDEGVDERAVSAVEAEHGVIARAGEVEISVWSFGQAVREVQPA